MAKSLSSVTLSVLALVFCVGQVSGQGLARDEMTDGSGWSSRIQNPAGDTSIEWNFDYSTFGIPEAPNSEAGDSPTRGLVLQANEFSEIPTGVAMYPTDQSFTGKFTYQFDMWINTIGPFPLGGAGSTQFGGGSIGFDPNDGGFRSGATFMVSGDGGSSNDYRLYADDEYQNYETHEDPNAADPSMAANDLYDPKMVDILPDPCPDGECGGDNADNNAYVENAFPGVEPPALQQTNFPSDQFGLTKNGAGAFQWMTVKFTVDTDAGSAFVQMTSATSGETVDVGTFTYENTYDTQETIETKILTDFSGNVSLAYMDPFESLTFEPDLMFGLFDNVMVTVDEVVDVAGDMNGDGSVNFGDLNGFVLALTDAAGYEAAFPDLDRVARCDASGDGSCNFGDLGGFVALLTGGGAAASSSTAIPEPSALLILLSLMPACLRPRGARQ